MRDEPTKRGGEATKEESAIRLALTTLCALALFCSVAQARTLEQRIGWLQERVSYHRYVCKHGANYPRRWHCAALKWTTRELGEAVTEKRRRDWAIPPEPWFSVGRCEQRDDHEAWGIKWDAFSTTYEGAFGFLHSTWDQYRLPGMPTSANLATPREQVEVARIVLAHAGWAHGWPSCSLKLGLR